MLNLYFLGRIFLVNLIISCICFFGIITTKAEFSESKDRIFALIFGICLLAYVVECLDIWFFQVVNYKKIRNLRVVYFSEGLVITDIRENLSTQVLDEYKRKEALIKRDDVQILYNRYESIYFIENLGNDFDFDYSESQISISEEIMWMRDWKLRDKRLFFKKMEFIPNKRELIVFIPLTNISDSRVLFEFLKKKEKRTVYWIP